MRVWGSTTNTAWGTNGTRPEVEGRHETAPASGSTRPEPLREQELLGAPVCRCLCSIVCAMLAAVELGGGNDLCMARWRRGRKRFPLYRDVGFCCPTSGELDVFFKLLASMTACALIQ